MGTKPKGYQPSLGYDWLLPLYDPLFKWFLREDSIKRRLVAKAGIRVGHRVLDVGCGTATLTLLVKSLYPDAEVLGLDGDPKALAVRRRKARKAGGWRLLLMKVCLTSSPILMGRLTGCFRPSCYTI